MICIKPHRILALAGLLCLSSAASADFVAYQLNPTEPFWAHMYWTAPQIGWTYTPAQSFALVKVETKFRHTGTPRMVTVQVFRGHPSAGGQLLRSVDYAFTGGVFSGPTIDPLPMEAGTEYFIGFSNVAGMGCNLTNSGTAQWTGPLRYSWSTYGNYGGYGWGLGDQTPILRYWARDIEGPVFSNVPDNVTVTATQAGGAYVTYTMPTAVDALEGPVPVTASIPSGSLFPPGTTEVTFTAADSVGNVSTAHFNVTVNFSGTFFLPPIKADGKTVFKAGSCVPVKFTLTGLSAGIPDLVADLSYGAITGGRVGDPSPAVSRCAATTGSLLRYDPTGGIYIFNWDTKGLAPDTYELMIDLHDGLEHTIVVTLK